MNFKLSFKINQTNFLSFKINANCLHSTKISHNDDSIMTFDRTQNNSTSSGQLLSNSASNSPPKQHSTMISDQQHQRPNSVVSLDDSSIQIIEYQQVSAIDSLISSMSDLIEEEEISGAINRTYVVSSEYEATFYDDLTVQFAETVKILRDNNDDWLYVQVATDRRCGFVPRTIVLDLKQFVKQLKEEHYSLMG